MQWNWNRTGDLRLRPRPRGAFYKQCIVEKQTRPLRCLYQGRTQQFPRFHLFKSQGFVEQETRDAVAFDVTPSSIGGHKEARNVVWRGVFYDPLFVDEGGFLWLGTTQAGEGLWTPQHL